MSTSSPSSTLAKLGIRSDTRPVMQQGNRHDQLTKSLSSLTSRRTSVWNDLQEAKKVLKTLETESFLKIEPYIKRFQVARLQRELNKIDLEMADLSP